LKICPVIKPLIDMGKTDRDGLVMPVAIKSMGWAQRYEIETADFSPQALALSIGASNVQAFSQGSTPLVNVPLLSNGPDSVIVLTDANDNPLFNVQSIQSVTSSNGLTTYATPGDYLVDPAALQAGLLEIPPGSSIPANVNILVSMTPAAISGQRLLQAQQTSDVRFRVRIVWVSDKGAQLQVHGPMDAAILPKSQSRDAADYSGQKFDLYVLDDGSGTPAGQLILPIGAMPADGY
jgi:hypothetical protein